MKLIISGLIEDAKTKEFLSECNIYLKSDRINSVYSNEQGRFTLKIVNKNNRKEDVLMITNAGYQPYKVMVKLDKPLKLEVKLSKRRDNKEAKSSEDYDYIQAALGGDQRAYGHLMARYRDAIYFTIQKMVNNREDAEDLTIEAFSKAFNKLHNYNPSFAFSTWLYRIAINGCIDFIRKKRLATISQDPEDSEYMHTMSGELSPEDLIVKQERILKIRTVIERLSPRYRKLVEMRYLQELSYDEIVQKTGLPLGTVKAQLFRAKQLLRNVFTNETVNK